MAHSAVGRRARRHGADIAAATEIDLDSLLAVPVNGKAGERTAAGVQYISIAAIQADPRQPRKVFNRADLAELIETIQQHGVLQPVMVTPIPTWNKTRPQVHTLIMGERRWRAAQAAGLEYLPAMVRDVDDRTALELQLTENVQRRPLEDHEFADACRRLITEFNLSLREVARRIGKSPATISKAINVHNDPILSRALQQESITYAQAQEMLALENRAKMQLVKEVAQQHRETGSRATQKEVRERARELQPAPARGMTPVGGTERGHVSSRNTPAGVPARKPLGNALVQLSATLDALALADDPADCYRRELRAGIAQARDLLDQIETLGTARRRRH